MSLIRSEKWTSNGKLLNHGKNFFLRLAADAVNDAKKQPDEDGLTYVGKAMIMFRLALNKNGIW